MAIKIPVSNGELLDKISILKIKIEYAPLNPYIHDELTELIKIALENFMHDDNSINRLYEVNKELWKVEDRLRVLEKENRFDNEFIQLARNVYKLNDKRALIKKEINEKTNSTYMEVKLYD